MRYLKLSLIVTAAIAAPALAGALVLGGGSPDQAGAPARAADPGHERPAAVRTLAIHTDAEPAPSAHPMRMRALLIKGKLPAGVVAATVLTDEDCAPDARGVSHCRNRLRLPDGRKLTVRHPHRMSEVPCMTPGETVRLGRAA